MRIKTQLQNFKFWKNGNFCFGGKLPTLAKKATSKIIVPEQKELYFLGKLPTLAKNNFKDYCIVPEQKELYLMGRLPTLEGTQLQKLKFRKKKNVQKSRFNIYSSGTTGTIFFRAS